MPQTQLCPECDMEFDWPGVEEDGETYCCEGCAQGEECTCPQHQHDTVAAEPTPMGDLRAPGPV